MSRIFTPSTIITPSDISKLESSLLLEPRNLDIICSLAEAYIQTNKTNKAIKLIESGLLIYRGDQIQDNNLGIKLYEAGISYWKAERFVARSKMRINVISDERKKVLQDMHDLIKQILKGSKDANAQIATLASAYTKECLGKYEESLSLLSDLITMQATDGVDLSYIIFKAAVILRHIGHIKQCLEYLEFVQDEPPVVHGFYRTHMVAMIVVAYELGGEKYKVFLGKAYKDLANACGSDSTELSEADPIAAKHFKRLETLALDPAVSKNSDIWEVLAVQALDRCEYVLAEAFLHLAMVKSPSKGPIIHWRAEVLYLLGDKLNAEKYAEQALELMPQSGEVRNLLLYFNPAKWTEKMRFLGPSQRFNSADIDSRPTSVDSTAGKSGDGGLVSKLRTTAASALQQVLSVSSNMILTSASSFRLEKGQSFSNNNTSPGRASSSRQNSSRPVSGDTRPKSSRKARQAPLDVEAQRAIRFALQGNTNIHFYEPTLQTIALIEKQLKDEKLDKITKKS